MKCPKCSSYDNIVVDSRRRPDDIVKRIRQCNKCSKKFTTHELKSDIFKGKRISAVNNDEGLLILKIKEEKFS